MAYFINDDVIAEIRSKANIVEVISEYVDLNKRGANYLGLCPFHKEKTPSFSVSESKDMFHCFGCGVGGDVITFVMRMENLGFVEAVKFLADKYNVTLSQKSENKELVTKKERGYLANREAGYFYVKNLFQSKRALSYLNNRKINRDVAVKFGLGMCPDKSDGLVEYLISKGFKEDELVEYNLAVKSSKGDKYYDRFRNRLMFPIIDPRGRVIAFGGRVFGDELPKYLNSRETIVYNKGDNLYGLNVLSKESDRERIILVEGYMDVISIYKSGINYSVASLGTALTPNQGKLLKRYGKEVIICYDGDNAGVNATLRAIDVLNSVDVSPKVLHLPEGLDPDDYIKKYGAFSFEALIKNGENAVEYKLNYEKSNYNLKTPDGLTMYINRALTIISKIKNPIERDIYTEKLSKDYSISKDALNLQLSSVLNYNKPRTDFKRIEKFKKGEGRTRAEEQLISYALKDKAVYDLINSSLTSLDFSDIKVRILFEKLGELYKLDNYSYNKVLNVLLEQELIDKNFADRILKIELPTDVEELSKELIINIKRGSLIEKRDFISASISEMESGEASYDKEDLNALVKELYSINVKLKSL